MFPIRNARTFSAGVRLAHAAAFSLAMLSIMAPFAAAQTTQPLNFFKNYLVTGDYAVGGVGLRGLGGANGLATGTITMQGIPSGADVVGAFLYWQTVEKSQSAFAGKQGYFNGNAITGLSLGNPNAPVSWSAGGCAGSSKGTTTLRTYHADVRPFLGAGNLAAHGNGSYVIKLADSGSNGGGTPLTLGASLVIIYRVPSPGTPLAAISIYDGTFAPSNTAQPMNLSIEGFYQASSSSAPVAKITHIVGNGQPNKTEQLSFNGNPLDSAPFPGALGGSWDNPTYQVGAYVPAGYSSPATTSVVPASTNSGCVSWGAVIFSTTVQDSDGDGLIDTWETNQGYTDISNGERVNLPGADPLHQDVFVQIDYLASHDFLSSGGATGHSHKPKQAALDMVARAFANRGIALHYELGAAAIDEDMVTCHDNLAATPKQYCGFPDEPALSWKGGFAFLKNHHLQHGRKDSYKYALFAHELGLAANIWAISDGSLISIAVQSGIATVTTATAHGLSSGDRVRVSGAVSPVAAPGAAFALNHTYPSITVRSATTFTFPTAATVAAGNYANPGLFVASGPARSTSGWSDFLGADLIVTLGLWRSDVPGDDRVGSALTQAGTFAHELGHTLGLSHGGGDSVNCKPNYQSVMNYLFQVRGLPGYDGSANVDYSGQSLADLDEQLLNEAAGIGTSPPPAFRTRWYGPLTFLDQRLNSVGGRAAARHCDGTAITDGAQMVRVEGPVVAGAIDWDGDGVTESKVVQDLSFNGKLDSPFKGFKDWDHLDLRQTGARRGVFGFSGDVWGTLDDGAGGTLDDGAGGTLDDGAGGTLDDGAGGTLDDGAGGTLDDGAGGSESDFNRANTTVDPPKGLNASVVSKNVVLTWSGPAFGQIRTYYIWRADTSKASISPTNLPLNLGKVTGAPPLTTFTDTTVKNNTTYTYFVTSALGSDSGTNNGNQSGASDMVVITVKF